MKQHLPRQGPFNALDIGCGNGAFLRAISEDSEIATVQHGVGLTGPVKWIAVARRLQGHIRGSNFRR